MPSMKTASNNILPPRTKQEKLSAIFGPGASTITNKKVREPPRTKAQKLADIHHSGTSSTTPPVGHSAGSTKNNKTPQQIKSEQREKLRLAKEWATIHNGTVATCAITTTATTTTVNHAKSKTQKEIKLEQREKIRLAQEWASKQRLEQDETIPRASVATMKTASRAGQQVVLRSTPTLQRGRAPSPPPPPQQEVYVILGTLIQREQPVL